jgi:hypothetical protein
MAIIGKSGVFDVTGEVAHAERRSSMARDLTAPF